MSKTGIDLTREEAEEALKPITFLISKSKNPKEFKAGLTKYRQSGL